MGIEHALVGYFVLLFLIFIILYVYAKLTFWSTLAFTLTILLIVLIFIYPPLLLITENPGWPIVIYGLIILISVAVIVVYVISQAVCDKRMDQHGGITNMFL